MTSDPLQPGPWSADALPGRGLRPGTTERRLRDDGISALDVAFGSLEPVTGGGGTHADQH